MSSDVLVVVCVAHRATVSVTARRGDRYHIQALETFEKRKFPTHVATREHVGAKCPLLPIAGFVGMDDNMAGSVGRIGVFSEWKQRLQTGVFEACGLVRGT